MLHIIEYTLIDFSFHLNLIYQYRTETLRRETNIIYLNIGGEPRNKMAIYMAKQKLIDVM
jgi:hypothetical protein